MRVAAQMGYAAGASRSPDLKLELSATVGPHSSFLATTDVLDPSATFPVRALEQDVRIDRWSLTSMHAWLVGS